MPKTRHHAAPGRAAGRWLVHPYPAFGLEDAPAKPPAPQGRRGKVSGRGTGKAKRISKASSAPRRRIGRKSGIGQHPVNGRLKHPARLRTEQAHND